MKVYVFSELWNQEVTLPDEEPDLVIHLGDSNEEWVRKIDEKYSCRKIGLLGEKDEENGYEGTGIEDFHGKKETIGGITFLGVGGAPIHREGNPPNQYKGLHVERILKDAERTDVLISHSNPAYREDFVNQPFWGSKRGFYEIGFFIKDGKSPLVVHGHVRQNYDVEEFNSRIVSVFGFKEINL